MAEERRLRSARDADAERLWVEALRNGSDAEAEPIPSGRRRFTDSRAGQGDWLHLWWVGVGQS